MKKNGITVISLIITIVILIVLTSAIAIAGSRVTDEAKLASFYNTVTTVQDAVQLQINNNLTEYSVIDAKNLDKYKWVGIIEGYTESLAQEGNNPLFNDAEIQGKSIKKLDLKVKKKLSISDEEFNKYYVDESGIVYYYNDVKGYESKNGTIYYNKNLIIPKLTESVIEQNDEDDQGENNQGENDQGENQNEKEEVLTAIEVITPPIKTQYIENEILDLTGMVIQARYQNGDIEIITSDNYVITPLLTEPLEITNTSILISYTKNEITKTVSYPIEVEEEIVLSSLQITRAPTKIQYIENETLDLTYMIVLAKYTNGDALVITDQDYTTEPSITDALTASHTNIVITYTKDGITKTVSQPIEVQEILLSSIEVTSPIIKTQYIENENLDLTGLVITANYQNGDTKILTSDKYITIPSITEALEVSDTNVVISYTEDGITKTANQSIEVEEEVLLSSIEITTPPTKNKYIKNETLDLTGLVITARYTNGDTKILTSADYTTVPSLTKSLQISDTNILLSYTEDGIIKTVNQSIEVEEKLLSSIEITTPPTKLQYIENEIIDLTGMIVVARYTNGDTKLLTSADYTTVPSSTDELQTSDTNILLSYTENGITKTVNQAIEVKSNKVLASIEITTPPTKTVYIKNQIFDPTGMTILARYTDNRTEIVTDVDYIIYPLTMTDTNIIIAYTENEITKSTTQAIEVIGLTLGELVGVNATYYGIDVDYIAGLAGNQVTDWQVLYKQTIDGADYVYLISTNKLTTTQTPTISGTTKTTNGSYGDVIYWNTVPSNISGYDLSIAQTYFMANWQSSNTSLVGSAKYTTGNNAKCIAQLLNTSFWSSFVSTDACVQPYVQGAIGSPTAEMWVASWNKQGNTQLTLTENSNRKGYKINNVDSVSGLTTAYGLYFSSNSNNNYWLASPSSNSSDNLMSVNGDGGTNYYKYINFNKKVNNNCLGIRPVICLEASIPAYWEDLNSRTEIKLGTP